MSIHALKLNKECPNIIRSSKQEQTALALPMAFPSHMDTVHHTIPM